MKTNLVITVALLLLSPGSTLAEVHVQLFSEDFESGLGQWQTYYQHTTNSAEIVEDPLFPGNHAVHFLEVTSGGDIQTEIDANVPGVIELRVAFDYLGYGDGQAGPNGRGGFMGHGPVDLGIYYDGVVAGTDPDYPQLQHLLVDDVGWRRYDFALFPAGTSFRLVLEDFQNSGAAGDAYFDNIEVYAVIPEPATLSLLVLGGLALLRRNR